MLKFDKVLGQAWRIIWKHKVLWLFGILAGCGSQSSPNFSGNFNFPSGGGNYDQTIPPEFERYFSEFQHFFERGNDQIIWIVSGLILFVLLLAALFFLIGVYGKVGLIQGTVLSDQTVGMLSFSDIHQKIKPFYWRAVLLNLVVAVAVLIIVFLIIFGSILTMGLLTMCLIPLMCLMVPLFILIGLVIEQANLALVLEDLTIGDAFQRGWEVFRTNLGSIIVMALILVLGGLIISIILSLPLVMVFMPVLIAIMTSTPADSSAITLGSVSLICGVIYLPVLIVLNGILQGYIHCAWTLTYQELTQIEEIEAEVTP